MHVHVNSHVCEQFKRIIFVCCIQVVCVYRIMLYLQCEVSVRLVAVSYIALESPVCRVCEPNGHFFVRAMTKIPCLYAARH